MSIYLLKILLSQNHNFCLFWIVFDLFQDCLSFILLDFFDFLETFHLTFKSSAKFNNMIRNSEKKSTTELDIFYSNKIITTKIFGSTCVRLISHCLKDLKNKTSTYNQFYNFPETWACLIFYFWKLMIICNSNIYL